MIMSPKDKSNQIKLLVVGLGGIGSQLTELIVPALDISGLNVELYLMDNDVVDESNLAHQRFSREDENSPKVEALQQRYQRYEHVKTIAHNNNLTVQSQLEGYDIIVVAVDRQEPRNLVHSSDAHWVDLRCQGDGWMLIDSDTNTKHSQQDSKQQTTSRLSIAWCYREWQHRVWICCSSSTWCTMGYPEN